ncbi:MAG TPA: RsmE family RNA methyltransferase [Candidatus Acidoferrales bacterium]|jgi:16S rRNA (uracil1498-N3)-methyltransferase|nr:RsmE family RNA methyltransferase [Candidatus Acidoferrales bacterium]
MRRRFFVEDFQSQSATLRGDTADHLGRVLRAEAGQLYELSDGHSVWLARVERVTLLKRGESHIDFALVEPVPASEPRVQIDLLLSLVKFDRFEWCLEKATELGAREIVPLAAARTEKALIAAAEKRRSRWERILLESAQQSRRLRPPVIGSVVSPAKAFAQCAADRRILLSERREAPSIREALDGPEATRDSGEVAVVAIGPEGGWTDGEVEAARAADFAEVSLGESILRTETAVVAAMAVVRFALA